ncbi:MAG TPA: glycosyltransferase family 39 protein [Acidimicrobiia bacterium]|nr:glycosyltransferase family 39 protein [Acidimicrobiia bacterium]
MVAATEGIAAEAPSRRRFSVGGPIGRGEWLTLALIVLAYLVIVMLSVRRGPPLGWDESVYALRARGFADGVGPLGYWDDFRAPGLPWLGHLWWVDGREVVMLRLLVAGFGLGLVGVTWLLTRHLFGAWAGLVAAAGVAVTPPLVLAATQVWPDVPGAAVGLLAVALFAFSTGGDRPSWWMLSAVPAVAAATYLRFGAPLPIAIGLLVVAIWRRRVLLRGIAPVAATVLAATAVVVVILQVPFLTGGGASPLGAIGGLRDGWFTGFADDAGLGDQVFPTAVILALVGAVAAWGFAGLGGIDRGALVTVAAVGLATAAAIAFVLHGEVRYLAPAFPWVWIAGAPGLERLARAVPGRAGPVAAALVLVALAAGAVGSAQERNRGASQNLGGLRRASEAIAEKVGGRPCLVVTGRLPQVMWYSGCDARLFALRQVRLPAAADGSLFMLFYEGDPREPQGALRAAYLAEAGEPLLTVDGYRDVVVYLVGGSSAGG